LNALNVATISDLNKAFKILAAKWRSSCYCFKVWWKAFVAGADISEFAHFIAEGAQLAAEGQEKLFDFVENLKRPLLQPWTDLHWVAD
jgi:enoyl-CoA hydratase